MDERPEALDLSGRLAIARDVYESLGRLQAREPDPAAWASAPAIVRLREVVGDYVRREPSQPLRPVRGEIPFPEAGRVVSYRLPVRASDAKKARVVLERTFAPT
jgi:hypothetical protein